MFPFGGVGVMLLGAVLGGVVALLTALALRPRFGAVWSFAFAGLLWSLLVIGLVTLIPTSDAPGIVYAETRQLRCSRDIGGPAPDGFWIIPGGQRLLNALVFVPSGALLVLVATRWRAGWVGIPLGLGLLAAYSAGIEKTQLELARIDRACDFTDIVDNVSGAVIGVVVGLGLAFVLWPWHARPDA